MTSVPPVNKAFAFAQFAKNPLHVLDLWRGRPPRVLRAAAEDAPNTAELRAGWIELAFSHCYAQAADDQGLVGDGRDGGFVQMVR